MTDTASIDVLLATLNSADVGSLDAIAEKMEQVRDTGASFVATACANCKRQITQLMEYYDMDVQVGGVHDLVYTSIVMD